MRKKFFVIIFIPVVQFLVSFLLPFVTWPEMINWPFFLNSGWQPYRDFLIIHTPVLVYLLAGWYRLLGFNPFSLHLFGAVLLSLSSFLLGGIVYRDTRELKRTIMASLIFLFLSFGFSGNHVWFESLLVPVLLGAFFFQSKFVDDRKTINLFFFGTLMGVALLTKQTAAYLFPVIFLIPTKKKIQAAINIFSPILILIAIFIIFLISQNILRDFLEFGVRFVFLKPFVGHSADSYFLLPNLRQLSVLLILFSVTGFAALKKLNFEIFSLVIWIGLSVLFAFPRFDYFHLTPALAFIAILMAKNSGDISKKTNLFLILILISLSTFLIIRNLNRTHTFLEPQVYEVANYINEEYPNASIFSLNGPDQIYSILRKMPAVKPWIPQLPWYLGYYGPKFLRDIKRGSPEIIIFSPYLEKPIDGLGAYQPREAVDFFRENYRQVKKFDSGFEVWERI